MNRITKVGNVRIIDDEYVLKQERDLSDLENYLKSRNYEGFIHILERSDEHNKYPFIRNFSLDNDQLGMDIISNVALLHNKTSYKKEVGVKKNKDIYDNINGYIKYLSDYFKDLVLKYEYVEFPSPSNILFMSNYSKIEEALTFCKKELDIWYKQVKDKSGERVSLVHGNLRLDHAIYNDHLYLCSWSKARFDTPIVDFIEFYHNEWDSINFQEILEEYLKRCELKEDEKKLLFINLALPKTPVIKENEFTNIINMNKLLEYIYRTERLITPYYTEENKEK